MTLYFRATGHLARSIRPYRGYRLVCNFQRPLTCQTQLLALPCRGLNSSFYYPNTPQRVFSTNTKNSLFQQEKIPNEEFRLIYEGPLSRKIKLIKLFSLSTAAVSIVAAPFLVLHGKASVPFIGKMLLAGTVITMGVTTTILLNWLTRVYVHRMYFHPHSRTFSAETFNFLGRPTSHIFTVEDIVVPEIESAFSTFEVNGRKFFVHMELKEADQILKYVREYNLEKLS